MSLKKTILKKDEELSTKCSQLAGMLWPRTLGDESRMIKFRRPKRWMSSPRWEPIFRHAKRLHGKISSRQSEIPVVQKRDLTLPG